ncbi:MAG: hypothetical protein FWB98_05525 [Defluviitaleaceae bacterium]|nr:hypothetical protein [Defluviitaleaceae bacterium]
MQVSVQLRAQKLTLGTEQIGGEFNYQLIRGESELVESVTNNADGSIVFSAISFDEAESYDFQIVEEPVGGNWENNAPTSYNVTVVVEDNGGALEARINYPEGFPIFTNTYTTATKGLIMFEAIEYTQAGIYHYVIREITPSGGGWTTDGRSYEVIVTIEDDGYGNLIPSISYPNGFPEFINTYSVTPVCVVITANKAAIGADLPEGRFEFGLFDEYGYLTETTTNRAADRTLPNPPQ